MVHSLGGLSETTQSFLDNLIEGKRISNLGGISRKFTDYYKMLNKEEGVTVISARDLTAEQMKKVQKTLEETYAGTTFTVKYQVATLYPDRSYHSRRPPDILRQHIHGCLLAFPRQHGSQRVREVVYVITGTEHNTIYRKNTLSS